MRFPLKPRQEFFVETQQIATFPIRSFVLLCAWVQQKSLYRFIIDSYDQDARKLDRFFNSILKVEPMHKTKRMNL